MLPPTYPLRPPSFRFLTPSGRFEANREICLSISGHHEETWQPAWGLRTALVALRAFMESDPKGQVGGLDATDAARRRLASESGAFVCTGCGGRSNAAILAESAEEERLLGESEGLEKEKEGEIQKEKEQVPAELQLVFRDELKQTEAKAGTQTETTETTEKTEKTDKGKAVEDAAPVAETPPAPQPAHAVPVPTPTIPLPDALREPPPAPAVTSAPAQTQLQTQAQVQAQRHATRARRNSDEAVPLWVDRTIVVLCIVLVAMLLRIFFG
ncbi:ubiquitin-conjugating enzyme [Ophiostoma piceae UAMH 11346]|uniref:Ubiquitin-conjugating enzyme n=1 Tax=Ophiostoma piceae (strain UAMH 11346) TaxID=1262450 RepID=S3CD89_OPHP1|nr:ubiquitin-conjugating enzyme [Ophiostoma piceae UAMH 11346]